MTDMPELSDDYLRAVAAARAADPHHLFKESGARQRDAVLAIVREPPPPPADIDGAKDEVAARLLAQVQRPALIASEVWRPSRALTRPCTLPGVAFVKVRGLMKLQTDLDSVIAVVGQVMSAALANMELELDSAESYARFASARMRPKP